MELFTFLRMGGGLARITVVPIAAPSDATPEELYEANQVVYDKFTYFKASHAKCFDPNDKARLLGIVEASFGTLTAFDSVVHKIFSIDNHQIQRISKGALRSGTRSRTTTREARV